MKISDRVFYSIFFLFIAFNLYWILSLRILPFIDLPFHLAASTIFKEIGEQGNSFSDFYYIPTLIKSNIFHLLFTSLKIFPSVEFGNKVFYSIYVIIFPLSSLFLIRYIGGNKWFSLLSFIFLYNHNCHWGFTGYTMSIPLLFIFFIFAIKYFEENIYRYYFTLMGILLIIFSMHFQVAIFASLIFGLFAIIKFEKNLKYFLKNLIVPIPLFIVMYLSYSSSTSNSDEKLFPYLINYYLNDFISSIFERLKVLGVMDNFYFIEGTSGAVFAAFFSLCVALPIILYFYKYKKNNLSIDATCNKIKYLKLITLSSLSCYLLLPHDIPGQNIIYQRFSVIFMISLIILCSYFYKNIEIKNISKIVLVVILVIYFIFVSDYYNDFKKETSSFSEEIFPSGKYSDRLFGLIYDNTFKGRPVYIHFPMYFTVWKKGITGGLVDYRFGVIKRKADFVKLPYYREWIGKDKDYKNEYDNIEYVLLRNKEKINIYKFDIIEYKDEWFLYRNTTLK